MKPGEAVVPASLSVLGQVTRPYELKPDSAEGHRRLALAKWITSDDNPLTPRVLANRVWQYHFGAGIVDTPSDFGFFGSRPTHPELLDYLASRLVVNGWKLKPLHREILLSQAYQQSAAFYFMSRSTPKVQTHTDHDVIEKLLFSVVTTTVAKRPSDCQVVPITQTMMMPVESQVSFEPLFYPL